MDNAVTLTREQADALAAAASIIVAGFNGVGGGRQHVEDVTDDEAKFLAVLQQLGLLHVLDGEGCARLMLSTSLLEAIGKASADTVHGNTSVADAASRIGSGVARLH